MGSPLSPALCLMVVSISKQIWSINFKQILCNHHLFIRHITYADNRLIFGDSRLRDLPPYEVLLDEGFLGFMLETKPLELIYQGPTNISQVLSPFSASPPKVLLSGFRSRCHIVVKGAFPDFRVRQGLDQLIHLYTLAGFPNEELHTISTQIMHRTLRSSKLFPQIQMPIPSSFSRQSTWPTLPAICLSLRRLLPNMLRIMNWMTSRRSPTRSGASCTLTLE